MALMPLIAAGPGTGAEGGVGDKFQHFNTLMAALPDWVQHWLVVQRFIFALCLLFVIWQREAQIYLAAILVSHALSLLEIIVLPVDYMKLDLVALNHWVWIPVLIVFLWSWPKVEKLSAYGMWFLIATAQLIFSLIFDLRDGVAYLRFLLG